MKHLILLSNFIISDVFFKIDKIINLPIGDYTVMNENSGAENESTV